MNPELTTQQKSELEEVLQQFKTTLSDTPGKTLRITHHIKTGDSPPINLHPYRVPVAWKDEVKKEIQTMLELGVIKPSDSPWAAPIVTVKKKDGSLRMCVDYRKLNSVTQNDSYQMPRVEELIEQLGDSKYTTTLDLTKGYYQVPVDPADCQKTAFLTPFGKFEFQTMPFGLKNAPTTFQRLMDNLLVDCHGFAAAYLDDIVVHSQSWREHLDHLRRIFTILQEAGLTIKVKKCQFGMAECAYLGHIVGKGKIKPEIAKIEAVQGFKQPVTKKDMRAFLGLVGYYRRFIPDFASKSAELSDMTKKNRPQKISWTPSLNFAFRALKESLLTSSVLLCPDYGKPFLVQTDASHRGVGAVLSQQDEKGIERPVAFYSRKLLPRELNYSATEKECLAIVNSLKHFEVHLLGRKFTVQTDHQALHYLQQMQNSNYRLTRWALALQQFDFDVLHRPGTLHSNADGLSRQAWESDKEDDELPMDNIAESNRPKEGEGDVGAVATAPA